MFSSQILLWSCLFARFMNSLSSPAHGGPAFSQAPLLASVPYDASYPSDPLINDHHPLGAGTDIVDEISLVDPSAHSQHQRRSAVESRHGGNRRSRQRRCKPQTPKPKRTNIDVGVELATTTTPPPSDGNKVGDATYYATGLGACGQTSTDSSMIAAASQLLFDTFPGATANPNNNPICGRKVRATYQGKSVEVEIVDRCVGCAIHDLDFSPEAFKQIGPMEQGRLHGMTWEWI